MGVFRRTINYTYRYGLVFWKKHIHKDGFNIFRKNIFSAKTDVVFYITCNTSTLSVSVTSNYAEAFNINF